MLKGLRLVGAFLLVSGAAAAADEASGERRISPGACHQPAVTDFKIVNDRWPDASSAHTFSRDVVRLSGAKTDQDKALALWQWIRRCTMRIKETPEEPSGRRRGYVDDPVKILNVYGAHHCDGLSRVMQNCWRALGYRAQKYYRNGHTYADCWWVDADGVGRYHTFDMNYGWFAFTRDGSRLATGEEIGTDFSLCDYPSRAHVPWIDKKYWMWAWVHAPHRPFSRHDMHLQLHPGDSVERLWGNLGRPYQDVAEARVWDDPDPRPYPWTYGNGLCRLTADLQGNWRDQLAAEPVNAAVRGGRLVQADAGRPGEVVYRLRTPYIVADADIEVTAAGGRTELAFSHDEGRTWRSIASLQAGDDEKALPDSLSPPGRGEGEGRRPRAAAGVATLTPPSPCKGEGDEPARPAAGPARRTVRLTTSGLDTRTGPIGRYDYLLKVQLDRGAALSALCVDTIFQHNFLALPTLLPGENTITLTGRLAEGWAVQVTYVWDDPTGEGLTHTVEAEGLPFTYTIRAAGRRWKDVRCRRLTVRAVAAAGKGGRVLTAPPEPPASAIGPIQWTDVLKLPGPRPAPTLKTTAEYLQDLDRGHEKTRRLAAAGLIVRRDPQAWEALERIACEDVTVLKYYAIQALWWTDAGRAWPVMKRMLERDPKVKWPDVPMTQPQRGMWLSPEAPVYDNVAALISVLLAQGQVKQLETADERRWTQKDPLIGVYRRSSAVGSLPSTEATPLLCAALSQVKYPEPRWCILRSLGRLGDPRAVETVRRAVRGRGDDAGATAVEAAGRLGDTEVIPRLKQIVATRRGYSIQRIKALEALGRLGAKDATDILLPYLSEEDEDYRGAAAEALGRIGDPNQSVPALESALKGETFPWVREQMEAALKRLRSQSRR